MSLNEHSVEYLSELQRQQDDWVNKTFPVQSVRGKCKHLIREATELYESPTDKTEMADCLLLLLNIAAKAGVSADELVRQAWIKFEICKGRKWNPPDADGVITHVKEAA